MSEWLAIFVGGGIGSLLRYSISRWVSAPESGFPVGTLIANMLACMILGLVWGFLNRRNDIPPYYGLLILTGFCGGFSTFSTFSLETLKLIQQDQYILACLYVAASVLLGCLLVLLGMRIAQ